jgi:SAM-dependent methyltransferase
LPGDRLPPIEGRLNVPLEPATLRATAVVSLNAASSDLSVTDQIALQDADLRKWMADRVVPAFLKANGLTLAAVAVLVVLDEINIASHLIAPGDRIAAPMVAAAEKNVAAVGLRNVSTRVCPADALSADMEPFDAAISRLVLMLVPDPVAVARAVLAVLRPGGAFSALVPGDQAKAGFNAIVLDILARHGGKTDWEDKPGSIRSLVNPVRLEAVLRNAGFTEVRVGSIPTVQRLESASETTTMIREGFAFFTALIADLSQERQDAAWAEVEQALKRFEGAGGFAGPSEVNLAVGHKPMG